jgi:hypothetical protein
MVTGIHRARERNNKVAFSSTIIHSRIRSGSHKNLFETRENEEATKEVTMELPRRYTILVVKLVKTSTGFLVLHIRHVLERVR